MRTAESHSAPDVLWRFEAHLAVEAGMASATVRLYARRLRSEIRHGLDADAWVRSEEAARHEAERYMIHVRGHRSRNAANAVGKILNALSKMQGYAYRVRKLKEEIPPTSEYSERERVALMAAGGREWTGLRARALVSFALATGMRKSEVAAACRSDLNPLMGQVYVRQPAKGGKKRWLPVEAEWWHPRRALAAWLAWLDRNVPGEALWVQSHGQDGFARITADGLANLLRDVGREAGVKANFIRGRHTRALQLLRAGVGIRYIQVYLGHARLETTARYTQVGPADVAQEMRRAGLNIRKVVP